MNRFGWPILAMLLFASFPTLSRAGYELVVNGDFQTGNFTGWTAGLGKFVALDYGLNDSYGVKYGSVGVASQLYQTIATTAGSTYSFSFLAGDPGRQAERIPGVLEWGPGPRPDRHGGLHDFHPVHLPRGRDQVNHRDPLRSPAGCQLLGHG